MRSWTAVILLVVLLVVGGVVLAQVQSGQPLSLTQGYVPQLDSTQALLVAAGVGFLVISVIGMGVTLAVLMGLASRQVAEAKVAPSQPVPAGAGLAGFRLPFKLPGLMPGASNLVRLGAVAANVLVLAFVAFLTINHYILNPEPEGGELGEPPSGGVVTQPTLPPPPAGPAGLQAAFDALPPGDAAQGQTLFTSQPCSSCHSLQADLVLVGPSLAGVGTRAETRIPGYTPEMYLYESLVHPDAHVVEGFQNGLMPPNFGQTLTQQQQADLIAFLLSQK